MMYDGEENERSIGESDCTHSEDAGVKCNGI